MEKLEETTDYEGRQIRRGDIVSPLSHGMRAKISDICIDELDMVFVQLRPEHRPTQRGVWHPADRVVKIAANLKS